MRSITKEELLLIRLGLRILAVTTIKPTVVAARFATGRPLNGQEKTDATWWRAGRAAVAPAAPRGRWAYRPGWQRMLIRWAVLAALVGVLTAYAMAPTLTVVVAVVLIVLLVATTVARVARRWRTAKHEAEVVQPVFEVLAQYLKLDPQDRGGEWLTIEPNMGECDEDTPVVRLKLPRGLDANPAVQSYVDGVISRHVASNLKSSWKATEATWRKPAVLPRSVPYDGGDLPATQVPIAEAKGGKRLIVDMESESPHWFVTASTGAGKSSTLRVPAAHCRSRGMLIDIIDPKRRSFLELVGTPGIRVHTDIEAQMWALEEFYVDMAGVNAAVEAGADPDEFPFRTLIIDEFGSFMAQAQRRWKRMKAAGEVEGDPPFMDQFMMLGWQGRQARRYMILGVHQPSVKVFGSTDVRAQFGNRIVTGAFSKSLWVTTFGYVPRISWNSKIKGRGVVGLGESEEQINEAQIAYISPADARTLAESGPEPPAWYVNMELPPWVTGDVLSQAARQAGVSLLSPRGTGVGYAASTVDPVPGDRGTGVTPMPPPPPPPSRPAEKPLRASMEIAKNAPDEGQESTLVPPVAPSKPPQLRPVADDPDLIIGLAAAAEFLGYETKGAFRQARRRWQKTNGPIPGEKLTPNNQPCWSRLALRNWQAGLPIAGKKWADQQGDS